VSTTSTLFGERRNQMTDSIRLTIESLAAYGPAHEHWALAWSGGKDSTALVTLVVWLIESGKVAAPKSLTVLYADTRLELLPLALSADTIREELAEHAEALAAKGCALDVRTVVAPMDKRFLVYILGRGVPPPNNNTLRWCTRQIKVDPMRVELETLYGERGDVLMLTGVRLGESSVRDGRIALSCSKGDGECGQGWYQRDLADRGRATLAPILHWRVCHVWEWLKHWATQAEYGDWTTALLAEVYGGDEAEELHARTGCTGCPLAERDLALDSILARPQWAYLQPLKRLRPVWRRLREAPVRLRKRGVELRKDGTAASNPQRMGPITFEARLWALGEVLGIQAEINAAADAQGRPRIDLLNAEEEARIRELVAAETWPDGWTGEEPLADVMLDRVFADGTGQPLLRGLV
jgi:DNA sulfur modification protein DndC